MADSTLSPEGAKKTAVLLLTLGEQFAAEVFKRMEREELAAVSRAMVELETVPKETVDEVLREYYHALVTGREMIRGGQDAVDLEFEKHFEYSCFDPNGRTVQEKLIEERLYND